MNFPTTKSARDADTDVLSGKPQFLLTMRASGVHIRGGHSGARRIQSEIRRTEFALHPLTEILPINLQLFGTFGAVDKQSDGNNLNHGIEFLKGDKHGNFNAVALELRVEQCPTGSTMNHVGRHVIATIRAGATGPSRHFTCSNSNSRWIDNFGRLQSIANMSTSFDGMPEKAEKRSRFDHRDTFISQSRDSFSRPEDTPSYETNADTNDHLPRLASNNLGHRANSAREA